MTPLFSLYLGDCLQTLRTLPDNSVDAVVTDPPYGLSFMGKRWDYDVPSTEVWAECLRVLKPGGHLLAFAGTRTQHRMAVRIEDAGFEIRDMIAWVYGSGFPKSHNLSGDWQGWGTALKPALEPITVARKPLAGTVAANVLAHGTGALNIDGCRVGGTEGRWPANLIHDGSDEVVALFPETKDGVAVQRNRDGGVHNKIYGAYAKPPGEDVGYGGGGSCARFFYCAKTSRKDRGEDNTHPTVKPTDLMAYLCRLVTPPGGIVLDPFMGSGSTGKAAMREGFRFIGCELDPDYFEIARARIENELPSWSIGMPTYLTSFDPDTKQPTGPSSDSGFGSIDEAVAVLGGGYLSRGKRSVTYPGVFISDYVLTSSSRQVKLPADS